MFESTTSHETNLASCFRLTYVYMALGILITGVSSIVSGLTILPALVSSGVFNTAKGLVIGIVVMQLALVFIVVRLSRSQHKWLAVSSYLLFTVFEGVVISPVIILTPVSILISAFVSTAGLFGAMAVYGLLTKRDISKWSNILIVTTITIIIVSIINLFIGSTFVNLLISIVTVIAFSAWTAYDNAKLRTSFLEANDPNDIHGIAVLGALDLYLDFLNILLSLIRIFSNSK